jgi:tyrosyl-tRNA synthetase
MDKVDELLTRRVEKIYPSKEALEKVLRSGKKLKLYLGVDPTGGNLHLGHAVPLMKLQEFINLGHHVIFLVGNFTALCGDPSGHEGTRKSLAPTQISKNMATYKKQASKVLDFSKTEMKYNADWLAKLTFEEIIKLASNFTVQQMIERDLFQRRLKAKKPISLHEFLYPLLQGYDSVAMNVDLEVGGTDQTFNMLAGRALQKIYNKKEKFVLTTKMIVGLDGRQMSKSWGNTVNILDKSNDMYGKIMSLRDELILQYFEMCTNVSLHSIKEHEEALKAGKVHPMDLKKQLAFDIVKMYHSEKEAKQAQKEFKKVVQKGALPGFIPTATGSFGTRKGDKMKAIDLLMEVADKLAVPSRSEAKRMIIQGGVEVDKKKIKDPNKVIHVKSGMVLRYGKRSYVQLKIIK